MLHPKVRQLAGGLALAILLVTAPAGLRADPAPKAPPAKEGAAKPDPLKALREAFAKGVTVTPLEPKDLPKEVAEAAAKVAPQAAIKKARKQEIRHTMKYVAFDQPRVQSYQAVVVKDDKRVRVQVAPDGKKRGARPVEAAKDKKTAAEDNKEIEIPAKAARAVKAIKELYPDAVVKEITTEVYQDPSGTVDVLTYEIEFFTRGTKREMVASPEGVIPHLWKPIPEKELPRAVAETLAKEVPGGKVESASRFELRAGLQFAPLEKPRVVYQLDLEKDGTASKLALRADGTVVPAPVRPGANRAYLGIALEKNSTVVSEVSKDGPAERAGIRRGDQILGLGEAKVKTVADLLRVLQTMKPGAEVQLHVRRGDQTLAVPVKLAAPPG